ncbi:MAG: ChbG/HpnK family deacetylase [SAR202 cluster bacterium]|nr:ChbG/HpnK family deacetylase [SAR202 cluster bacterium]
MDVIVNADDLGISELVNAATFGLIERGRITSATLLANGPFIEESCSQLSRYPNCSFGVHLNVTEFQPLSGPDRLQRILNDSGEFRELAVRQVPIVGELAQGVFEEFCAQVDKLYSLGVQISHIDSHHYVLSMPRMLPILKRIQKRYGIRKARISRNIYAGNLLDELDVTPHALGVDPELGDRVSLTLRLKKRVYNWALRNYYRTKTSDGFSGFRLFYEYAKKRPMNHRIFEVNVHPANPYYDAMEEQILAGPWERELNFPVRLISYDQMS